MRKFNSFNLIKFNKFDKMYVFKGEHVAVATMERERFSSARVYTHYAILDS